MEIRSAHDRRLSRRGLLLATALGVGAATLAACGGTATPAPPAEATKALEATTAEAAVTVEATVAPQPASGEKVKIEFWSPFPHKPEEGLQLNEGSIIMNEFNEQNDHIEVVSLQIPQNMEKLITGVTGGNPPDLFWMDRYICGEWAARNILTPLDDLYESSKVFSQDDFWPELMTVRWNGTTWAVPFYTDVRAFYTNDEILEEAGLDPKAPPKYLAEVEEQAEAIFKADEKGEIERLGFTPAVGNPPGYLMWWIFMWQRGGTFLNADNTAVAFDEGTAGADALQWMIDVNELQGGFEKVAEFTAGLTPVPGQDIFMMGKTGMYVAGDWMPPNYAKYAPDLKYTISGLPYPQDGQRANYHGGHAFIVPRGAKHLPEAWEFVEFMMRPDNQLRYHLAQGTIPPYVAMAESAEYLDGEPKDHSAWRRIFVDEFKVAKWVPTVPGAGEMLAVVQRMYDEAMRKVATPEEAIAKGATEVQAILDNWAEQIQAG